MKTRRKLIAAAVSAAMMLTAVQALPAAAARQNLGEYLLIGEYGNDLLYCSEAGEARHFEYGSRSGVEFRLFLPGADGDALTAELTERLSCFTEAGLTCQLEPSDGWNISEVFDSSKEPFSFFLCDSAQSTDFYRACSVFFAGLREKYGDALTRFVYFPEFGLINDAWIVGFASFDDPDLEAQVIPYVRDAGYSIELCEVEYPFGEQYVITTADGSPVPGSFYAELHREFGISPVAWHNEVAGHGGISEDFLASRADFDAVTEEEILAAIEKYKVEDGTLSIQLSFDSLSTLSARTGIPYDDSIENYVRRPLSGMIAEGLRLGSFVTLPESRDLIRFLTVIDGKKSEEGWETALRLSGNDTAEMTAEEIGRILAYLDKYAGVPFTVLINGKVEAMFPPDPASVPWYWGTAPNSTFSGMHQLDDKGMLQWVAGENSDYQVYTFHIVNDHIQDTKYLNTGEEYTVREHFEHDPLYVVMPQKNMLRFVLRSDRDLEEAAALADEIVRKYYPQVQMAAFDLAYDLYNIGNPDPETADALMHDLAKAGLIEEFYGFGQIAWYQEVWEMGVGYSTELGLAPDPTAWDEKWHAVSDWLDENAPGYTLACTQLETWNDSEYYYFHVDAPEKASRAESFSIAASLYEQFSLRVEYVCPANANPPLYGQNALLQKGDVNLDCEIGLSDAVLLAKAAAGAGNGLTAAGRQNAELDGAEGISTGDLTALLRYLAGASDTL